MQSSVSPVLLVVLLAGVLALAGIVVAFRMRPAQQSAVAVAIAALPALVMLLLFYSLAIHMRQSLGSWPTSIGELGFPATLTAHCGIAQDCFSFLLLSMLAWPIIFLVCLLIRRWRVCVYYLGIYALACLSCIGAMMLAPSPFLDWWWD